jgi:uncharacterized OB-fold protein
MSVETYTKPTPKMEPEAIPFWEYLRQHEMHIQHCHTCQKWFFPPSTNCPNCLTEEVAWKPVAGTGKVWAWVTMHQSYRPAYKEEVPYNLSIIKLDEGAKVWTNVVECQPEDVQIGMDVRIRYDDVTDDLTLARFVPA